MRRALGNLLLIGGFTAFLATVVKLFVESDAFTYFNPDKMIESYTLFFLLGSLFVLFVGMGILRSVPKRD
jgi:hypothetical protein